MRHMLHIWLQVLALSLKQLIGYRTQAIVRSLYVLMYGIMMFVIIQVMFISTDQISTWTKDEVLLLFSVVNCLGLLAFFLFHSSFEQFLNRSLRFGELDLVLTKPISTRFWVSIAKPDISTIISILIMFLYFLFLLLTNSYQITPQSIVSSGIISLFSMFIVYNATTIYACSGFFATQSRQSLEILYKLSEYSQYPVTMFPYSVQILAFTILPTAFFGYLTTVFLLGKGTWQLFGITIGMAIASWYLSQYLWRVGLKRYESASR